MRILVLCLHVPAKTVQELKYDPDLTLVTPDDTEIPERLATVRPDVVLLNVGHLTAADQQRYQTVHHATAAPIVVLVEPDAATAIPRLGNSVADHLEFPPVPSELRQRLRMVAERAREGLIRTHLPRVQIDDLIIDRQAHIVQRQGKQITLSAREWDVLEILIQARGAPVSAEVIAARIWGQADDSERHTVKVTVGRLRLKIEPDPKTPRYILTATRGEGYRLAQPEQVTESANQHPIPAAVPYICLPALLTRCIGRDTDLDIVTEKLSQDYERLITLLGTAGVGKTTLSIAVVDRVRDRFRGGIVFVPLASLTNPAEVLPAIARALNIVDAKKASLLETIVIALRDQPHFLLILDNFEHVIEAGRDVFQLLTALPRLTVLITSRVELDVYGQQLVDIKPFTVPEPTAMHDYPVEALRANPALALFEQRAQAVNVHFHLHQNNGAIIARICQRLDGLPLAIELAAAQVRRFTLAHIFDRLDRRLDSLNNGPSNVEPRQRTLRGAIDWSYALLRPAEQQFFAALAIFADSWTSDAAIQVCGAGQPPHTISDHLATLQRHSLITSTGDGDDTRFAMLETIHEYAAEQLDALGLRASLADRHSAYYHALAALAHQHWDGPEHESWAQRLTVEYANFRAALAWTRDQHPERFVQLCSNLHKFWSLRGYLREAHTWLSAAVHYTTSINPSDQARVLNALGMFEMDIGDLAEAQTYFEHSLAIRERINDADGMAATICNLGIVAEERGEIDQAHHYYTRSLDLYRQLGNLVAVGDLLNNLGVLADTVGDYTAAEAHFRESLTIYRQLNVVAAIGESLHNLAQVRRNQGDYAEAQRLFSESLPIRYAAGDVASIGLTCIGIGVLHALQGATQAAEPFLRRALLLYHDTGHRRGMIEAIKALALTLAQQRPHEASYLLTAAVALAQSYGFAQPAADARRYTALAQHLQQQVGAETWHQATLAARTISLEEAVTFALDCLPQLHDDPPDLLRAVGLPPESK